LDGLYHQSILCRYIYPQLRIAATGSGGKIEIRNSDSTVLATVDVPVTGGYQTWTTVTTTVTLPAGTQNIRLKSITNIPWNINWLQFGLVGQSPLPVKFVYFNAACQGSGAVALQWKTAGEQNTQRFSVQKSTDGTKWNEAGSVSAAGQSSQEKNYVFIDKTASVSSNFYRIVEYDYDGKTTISGIVRGSCFSKAEVALYPNPNTGRSTLSITLERPETITLTVLDSKGAIVHQSQVQLPPGNNSVPLNISSYPDGIYTIKVQYSEENKILKLIKK
jgi:hypothetical protein